MTLNVIVDVSGSMADMAKYKIERIALDNIVFYSRYYRNDVVSRVFFWNDKIQEVSVTSEIIPEGKSRFEPIVDFFTQNRGYASAGEKKTWLFLSDGNWKSSELGVFIDRGKPLFPVLRVLAIGNDADIFKLEQFAGAGNVFHAENVYAALECCLWDAACVE
jgi:hypothetical protein